MTHMRLRTGLVTRAELRLIIVTAIAMSVFSFYVEPFDKVHEFLDSYQFLEPDKIFALITCAACGSLLLFGRRARELRAEISRRAASEKLANRLAHHDPLTGLSNRREGTCSGRGDYLFHAEMDARLRARDMLETDLRQAVRSGAIIPHFQPVIDLGEGRIIGFEALARWAHPAQGMVQPDTFIPIAEDLGVIDEITNAMMRASCVAARDWPAELWVSVNISPTQLRDPWLASRLLAILTETGLAPRRLIIEVTENGIIDDVACARQIFSSLQNAGVRIALDDFGKGYSSLYHLRQLPFDHLKIDGSFVQSMDSVESFEIVTAVAGLGKSLGMAVTAEGVETSAEAEALRGIGCDLAQGFLFGKPLSAVATLALLEKGGGEVSLAA
jgi:EAL domain-containing protein (putative c-di-GMP-specific phosphodiesterase class I)